MTKILGYVKKTCQNEYLRSILTETFQKILFVFLLTLLVHEFKPLYIEHYISLNRFLLVVIVLGIIAVLVEPDKSDVLNEPATLNRSDYILIAISGIAGSVIVWYKIKDIGWVAYLISAMSGVLIITLSILMVEESGEGTDEFTKE